MSGKVVLILDGDFGRDTNAENEAIFFPGGCSTADMQHVFNCTKASFFGRTREGARDQFSDLIRTNLVLGERGRNR